MTPDELRAARKRLGLTLAQLARALRLGTDGKRAVQRWEAGDRPISGPVQVAVEMMTADSTAAEWQTGLPDIPPEDPWYRDEPEVWYWVSDGDDVWPATMGSNGRWTNLDCWEDFGGQVKYWIRIPLPPPLPAKE